MPQPHASPVETLVGKALAERILAEALLRGLTVGRGMGLAQLRGDGGVRAEVLDGLTREDADPIVGDGVRLVQTWRGAPEAIERLKARRIRLKFHMDNSDLYSFRAEP